jgi:hypothetical protein
MIALAKLRGNSVQQYASCCDALAAAITGPMKAIREARRCGTTALRIASLNLVLLVGGIA